MKVSSRRPRKTGILQSEEEELELTLECFQEICPNSSSFPKVEKEDIIPARTPTSRTALEPQPGFTL
jgi:hypothetical protein